MFRPRFFKLALSIGLSMFVMMIVLAVLPARSAVPHLGYGLITYHYDPQQLIHMNFGWIKLFNDPPQSPQAQPVLLRVDVTATTMLTDFQADLANKLAFAQYVDAWEIGNEPNIDAAYGWAAPPDALAYKTLLCAAYNQIKAADPNAIVVSAGLAPTGRVAGNDNGHPGNDKSKQDERQFLAELLDNGGGACLDVVGYHPYGYSADYDVAPDVVSADPPQNCTQGFCFRGAEKIYEIMQQKGIGDKKVWATEFGWITQPPDSCLSDPVWEGRQYQIVSADKQAYNLTGAYQYADEHWPWIGAMFVFNLDFNQNPDLLLCEQMRYYSIIDLPAYSALANMTKNPANIPGKLKTDTDLVSYLIGEGEQPITFALGIGLSNWGWQPVAYTATVKNNAAVVPALLNPTGILTGTAQQTLLMNISSSGRFTGVYTGQVTVYWAALEAGNLAQRKVTVALRVAPQVYRTYLPLITR